MLFVCHIYNVKPQLQQYFCWALLLLGQFLTIKNKYKMSNKNKIFLGGTCAETNWRNELISKLNSISYFNPVVEDWTPECQVIEKQEKENECNIHFYCITKEMQGVFSIAEVVDSVHNKSKRTILHVIPDGFEKHQLKSLQAVVELVNNRGGIAYIDSNLLRSARVLNYCFSNYEYVDV